MDPGRIVLEAPPDPPAPAQVNPLARLLPVAMIAAMGGMTLLYMNTTTSTTRSPMFLFFPVMMLISAIGTLAYSARGQRVGELSTQRADYLRYLDTIDTALADAAELQHQRAHLTHPHPGALWMHADLDRRGERSDDRHIRIGIGDRPCDVAIVAPTPEAGADPVLTDALQRLIAHRSVVANVPVTVALQSCRVLTLTGDTIRARSLARALVCQIATFHHPGDVAIACPASPQWDWVKWLPHQRRSGATWRVVVSERAGAVVSETAGAVVSEGAGARADATTAVVIVAGPDGLRVDVDGRGLDVAFDEMSIPEAAACARRIARHDPGAAPVPRGRLGWTALMGVDHVDEIDPDAMWSRAVGPARLRVPVGIADDGSVQMLDIKEAAAHGMGPHGLCIGATGSGKSEFLRTLVLGMIATHSPDDLNLVLVDFKGGATFLGLEGVHHVSAVITNLADEAPLVARMRDALSGEVNRRQELLRAAGLANVADYARDRTRPPLPALFIVVDEFSELLSQQPDFADLFVAIGRLGRSLGIHLLLASQRLDEGRLRGLETHLSYRVCLKTFSASESRAVLGVPDAYHLPPEPGAAYLKTAGGTVTRFDSAFVSGVCHAGSRRQADGTAVRRFTLTSDAPAELVATTGRPLLQTVVRRLAGRGTPAHRVWLPPLGDAPVLGDLLAAAQCSALRVPIGVVDCPFEQRRGQYVVDLSGAAGNVAIVGAPRTGKSTAVRTVLTALAATHDAAAVQFYCLDFGGGELSALHGVPHVGSVAGRSNGDLCRRIVAHVESVLRTREADPPVHRSDVFLVVDGWATVRQEFEVLEHKIAALAAQGLAYGVHVILTASRWADLRPALKDQIGTRVELRLGDPADSEMDRRRARELGDRPAGRGLTREGRETAIAVPVAANIRTGGVAAPAVELLPALVDLHAVDLQAVTTESGPGRIVLGLGERDLRPVTLNFAEHPHLMVLGDNGCGKTSLLRLLCTELATAPHDVRLEIVDFRRTLLGVVEGDRLGGYAVSGPAVTSRLAAVLEIMQSRMPDEHVTQRQLKDRSWWSGPDIYVVVDDYDLVAGATGNPLTPLADFLPHAADLGLHVVMARRSGGAARAMFDPVLARMRDMGCAGLMMSATPDDGVLIGTVRPGPLPPGRGTLVARGHPDELIQVGWVNPP